MTLSGTARLAVVQRATPWPAVVIGGGITGAAIARELAGAGVETLLLDARDFGSGTSSRSTRLLHGGLRYLEQGALRLVRDALRERSEWIAQAPHLAWPLQFGVPLPARGWARWRLRIGTRLYHALAGQHQLGPADTWSAEQLRTAAPLLARAWGGATYWDAQCDDARLTLALALDAEAMGAVIGNHARVERRAPVGPLQQLLVHDQLLPGHRLQITARTVIIAAGPEADALRDEPSGAPWLAGTKGSHISVSRARVPLQLGLVLTHPDDGRVCFALPAGPCTVFGTTDTATTETDPRTLAISDADRDYLLALAAHWFPAAALTPNDIWTSWAGVRPLLGSGAAPSKRSRDFEVRRECEGVWFVLGGKLTSAQVMARRVLHDVFPRVSPNAALRHRPLPGGALQRNDPRGPDAPGLWRRQGSEAGRVRAAWLDGPEREALVHPQHDAQVGEIDYAVVIEHARRVDDVLVRRLRLADETADGGRAAVPVIAARMAQLLGWTDSATHDASCAATAMLEAGRRSLV